jgi:hypothetical protein
MKKTIIILLAVFVVTTVFARQTKDSTDLRFSARSRNTFFVEFLGNNFYYSLNYDRILFQKKNFLISGRIGFCGFPQFRGNYTIGAPAEINLSFGKKRNFLETGFGMSYLYIDSYYFLTGDSGRLVEIVDQKINWLFIVERIGYRYQKPDGGFFFKVAFTPLFQVVDKRKDKYNGMFTSFSPHHFILPWIGISIGYTLKNKKRSTVFPTDRSPL